jgi:hypothetical protein
MQFYLVTHKDGTEWAATQGDAKARAKELGGTWEGKDVPTDKPKLLAFLNANCRDGITPSPAAPAETPIEEVEVPSLPTRKGNNDDCPRCQFDRRTNERVAAQWARQATLDARADWITEEADMMTVGVLAGAVAERYKTLSNQIRETA